MKKEDFDNEFRKEVNAFLKKHNLPVARLGTNKTVNYTCTERLRDYFERGGGGISSITIGKIKVFMNEYENSNTIK